MNLSAQNVSLILIELGLVVVGLAILARIAHHWSFSPIPFYLLAGLAFGNGGLAPLSVSNQFIHLGSEIGVLLLLFMLGLSYTGEALQQNLKAGLPAGIADFLLNFPLGFVAGLLLGWKPLAAILLGGVTYISSSSVAAKVLSELGRLNFSETPAVLSVLVLEDLGMAAYLPLVAVLLAGGGAAKVAASVGIALAAVLAALVLAIRIGRRLSVFPVHGSDEVVLLTIFGAVLLVSGLAQRFQISSAIGAFLVGIAVSGQLAEETHRLVAPLRDLFAAMFFFFFGLEINPKSLTALLLWAILLGCVTAATKVLTGYWAAQRAGVDRAGRLRAGMALIARGEFSIVIAGLGIGIEPRLEPFSAAYVLFLAIIGPILTRMAK